MVKVVAGCCRAGRCEIGDRVETGELVAGCTQLLRRRLYDVSRPIAFTTKHLRHS